MNIKILILCTGNSCRSQMAQGFLQSFDKDLEVHSAGTIPARQVNSIAIQVMKEVGIDISHHTTKSVDQFLNAEWDYVITVCGGALQTCPAFIGNVKYRLHIGFDDPSSTIGSDNFIMREFKRVRDEIHTQFLNFYNNLAANKGLYLTNFS